MGFPVGIGQPAGNLFSLYMGRVRGKRKGHDLFIAELFFHLREINTPLIHPGGGACLKTAHFDPHLSQRSRQVVCRLKPVGTGVCNGFPAQASGSQIGSRTQDYSLAVIVHPREGFYPCDLFAPCFRSFRIFP